MNYIAYKYTELTPDKALEYECELLMLKMKLNNAYIPMEQYFKEKEQIFIKIETEIKQTNPNYVMIYQVDG